MPPALVNTCIYESELWSIEHPVSSLVTVDCLLPNGLIIPLSVPRNTNLCELKKMLWLEAKNYPLHMLLNNMDNYIFMCVSPTATKEELVDESRRLIDIQPFHLMLKVVQKKGNRGEKLINSQISFLIGKGLQEFDGMQDPEINDFRKSMKEKCQQIEEERSKKHWLEQVLYFYPPSISTEISENADQGKFNKDLYISVCLPNLGITYTKRIPPDKTPKDLIQMTLRKRTLTTGIEEDSPENYCLKVVGQELFLAGDHKLKHFNYIQKLVSHDKMPQLVLVHKEEILENIPLLINTPKTKNVDSVVNGTNSLMSGNYDPVFVWKIPNQYSISVKSVHNVGCPDNTQLRLRVGIFHGGETLADLDNTKAASLIDGEAVWNTACTFNISVADLPRMARICFALYTSYDKKMTKAAGGKTVKVKDGKQKLEILPLAWLNMTIFDYKNYVRTGPAVFNMWTFTEDVPMEDIVNPIGTVEDNPIKEEAPRLEVVFHDYGIKRPIRYPPFSKVLECAAENAHFQDGIYSTVDDVVFDNADEIDTELLMVILAADPLTPMCEQEKKLVWKMRYECQYQYPHSLARVLSCVQWNNHHDVAQMMALLQIWPKMPPEQALELLDFCYAETSVRKFAVECLRQLSDEDLLHYLLQLVQALKYESYLECELVDFLLTRALKNRTIGHHLFWLLKSEMHVPSVAVRFGLILEAYCRGSTQHLRDLTKQCEALNKLKSVNLHIKDTVSKLPKDKALEDMRACLQQDTYSDALCGLQSTLDPSKRLRQLRLEKCKFKDSKMKPLWLVWENQDQMGTDVYMLFKNGDDLRQDMLTLQILRIMDKIWQAEGLDLRLIPYQCISTGPESGLIEIVLKSETIANIQKKHANSAILSTYDKTSLFKWFKDHNKDEESLNRAVEAFTMSCAGYCVATYVLGIGDRHNDNIMVTESGQLFHIDFGHFLGNFKSKFGVRRERVPFVLTYDFVYVITKGKEKAGEKDESFQSFRQYCERAYLILRSKGNFLISLFMMMLSTGIPELTCLEDIKYIRDTLALTMTDEEDALRHFRAKFDEALKNSWKTSLNWLAHNMARDNT